MSHQPTEKPKLSPSKKRLAPLNEGGPMQLLKLQIDELNKENDMLRGRIRSLEGQCTEALGKKEDVENKMKEMHNTARDEDDEDVVEIQQVNDQSTNSSYKRRCV